MSKIRLILPKIDLISWRAGGRSGGQLPGHNFAQHFFLCPTSMAQYSGMSETQKTSRQKHKQKHNQKATKRQLQTKWPISTPNSEREVWSFHTTIIRSKMVTCFPYVTISEAACASQRLHTRSCGHAMCLLGLLFPVISHLCVQSWALAAIFAIALSFVLLLLMPVMQVCPFVATCVAKSSCPQPKFCHWIFRPCFCPGPVFASVFCHNCCHYRCHCRFLSPMLPWRLPSLLPLPLFLPSRLPWLLPSNLGA